MSNTPIAPIDTPDPWILPYNSHFYFTFTLGDRIELWRSPRLEDFHSPPPTVVKSTIFRPARGSPWSADLWAPELHWLAGAWYVYFCGAPPAVGNAGHRTLVLRSTAADPMDPAGWEFLGPLRGLPDDQWSIDATVFALPDHNNDTMQWQQQQLYVCYSGWPLGDHSDTQQDLFLARLSSPTTAEPDTVTCISRATLPWERPDSGRRGVNEGPTFLHFPAAGFTGIVFSAHGSWTSEYKLGLLALVDPSRPCHPDSWAKRPRPLLVGGDASGAVGGPYAPGHACFVHDPSDPRGVLAVYHATHAWGEGWSNRKARVLRLGCEAFRPDAMPVCCATGVLGRRPGVGLDPGPGRPVEEQGPGMVVVDQQQQQQQQRHSTVWGQVGNKIPAPYRAYLDKVRKYF